MKIVAMVSGLVLLAGCVQQHFPGEYTRIHGPEPTPEDIAIARSKMMDCFVLQAERLDDRTSDASTIGKAVAGVCASHSREYARQRMWAKTDQQRSDFYNGWDRVCSEIATTAVLQQRQARLKN